MELGLKGKVAIVTGAGQGIGEQIAKSLAEEGVKVVVNDLFLDRAQKVTGEIKAAGGEAIAVKADVTDSEEVNKMVNKTVSELGRVDILVNNAGVPAPSPEGDPLASQALFFAQTDKSSWEKFVGVNLYGTMNCTRAVIEHMIKQNSGKIVNIISDAGRVGEPRLASYSAGKAGIVGFTKALAKEVGRHCINVNCVSLGATPHPGLEEREKALIGAIGIPPEQLEQEMERRRAAMVRVYPLARGLGRFGLPSDAANAVVFLASDAAAWITGQVLSVDGGYCMVS